MKYKYNGKRPFMVGEKRYVLGDISEEKHSKDFIEITVKKKKKIVKEEE
jgi:hypothetical protein|tara:strand:+ start:611 stop:757 length:147 start_codon:yes stop_codon:yes gene_type:complete